MVLFLVRFYDELQYRCYGMRFQTVFVSAFLNIKMWLAPLIVHAFGAVL